MTFYFKPPRGEIPFHRLEECIKERICYLKYVVKSADISECNECFKFEYLTDGSALDRTGHFMLRLLAIKLHNLKGFYQEAETLLFQKRLKHLEHSQVQRELHTAHRHVEEILLHSVPLPRYQIFLQCFIKLCKDLISSKNISHTFGHGHSKDCKQHSVHVPFTFCLPLVVNRDVDLSGGLAIVPCGKWNQLLSCVFLEHLRHGMHQLSASNSYGSIWSDDRMKTLFQLLRTQFKDCSNVHVVSSKLTVLSKDVDERSSLFPPCMKNLHSTLRQRHRLSHFSRLHYSLFLKDIGMPLMESVEFWSHEYAHASTKCSSCSHSWQQDSKRYIYSIRHLYGLEGSRQNYQCPTCHQLQANSHGPSFEGGCPFVDFDNKELLQCLHDEVRTMKLSKDSLLKVKENEGANKACQMYFQLLLGVISKSKAGDNQEDQNCVESKETENSFMRPSHFYDKMIQHTCK